jgi:hypothetical protein
MTWAGFAHLPPTEWGAPVMSWYGHLHGKGDHPSLLARHYRSHGHSDEFSQTGHRGRAPATAIRICHGWRFIAAGPGAGQLGFQLVLTPRLTRAPGSVPAVAGRAGDRGVAGFHHRPWTWARIRWS